MPSRLVAVAFDTRDPEQVAQFWSRLLDRRPVRQPDGVLLPGGPTQVGLRFAPATTEQPVVPRLHLHLTSDSPEHQQRTVEEALRLGARHLDVGQLPEEEHVVLADPGGHAFCVIEPGNRFLAGCGSLGEVTCEGSRDVGRFWSAALAWPLVWDQDGETAIQSPLGGTKVSWGGPPVPPKTGRNRQRFELEVEDVAIEVTRLLALGATRADGGELVDPDGNEFVVGGLV